MTDDEFRVEVALTEEEHGVSLGERLRTLELDDEAQQRLGSQAIVTRDGVHIFIYTGSLETAREARRVILELAEQDGIHAEAEMTRWHPIEASWKDAEQPLPESEEERAAELRARTVRDADRGDKIHNPAFVVVQSYEPEFMRDIGV